MGENLGGLEGVMAVGKEKRLGHKFHQHREVEMVAVPEEGREEVQMVEVDSGLAVLAVAAPVVAETVVAMEIRQSQQAEVEMAAVVCGTVDQAAPNVHLGSG